MAKQIQASPDTKSISDLYQRITSSKPTLITQPSFQRKFVWNKEHKEKFIETILKGLPFPEIYIAQSGIDLEKIETQEVVVDGQQRLRTIVQYIDEDDDSKEFGKIVPKYKDLDPTKQKEFVGYRVVIRDLGDIDPDTIKEVFKRINSTQYSLNQVELQNAVYDGKFITTAQEILDSITMSELPFLTESQISRMEDLYYVLLLISTIEHGGYFNGSKEIEKYIIDNNDEYANSKEVKEKFVKTFESIKNLGLPPDSIWYRKSNFFTLFIELYIRKKEIPFETLKDKLDNFENSILKNKELGKGSNDFGTYYSYMYVGTTSRQARVTRSKLFRKYIFNEGDKLFENQLSKERAAQKKLMNLN